MKEYEGRRLEGRQRWGQPQHRHITVRDDREGDGACMCVPKWGRQCTAGKCSPSIQTVHSPYVHMAPPLQVSWWQCGGWWQGLEGNRG